LASSKIRILRSFSSKNRS